MSSLLESTIGSSTRWLDEVLARIAVSLQLTPTQYASAEQHYLAVCKWLGEDELLSKFRPNIFPQGSLRIGTTVRPWLREEFDLDLVLWLALSDQADPVRVLDIVEARLRANAIYEPMVERKNRCIRLNFAGDFHMDILPGRPDLPRGGDFLFVPDRSLRDWKESNPKGYANWFEAQSLIRPLLLKAATVEPLPGLEDASEKTILQLVVQLLKRWRYVHFFQTQDLAPISIVLTTLAAQHYAGEAEPYIALRNIVSKINQSIPAFGRLQICNPIHQEEDLSERWDAEPEAYKAFATSMRELEQDLNSIARPEGIPIAKQRLEKLFGDVVDRAVRDQSAGVEKARETGRLSVVTKTGAITTAAGVGTQPVRPHTFYGE